MTVTLSFDCPLEQDECQTAVDAQKWRALAVNLDNQLRTWTKHGHPFGSATAALEAVRKEQTELMVAAGLRLYE
jgi:hypothetical protein